MCLRKNTCWNVEIICRNVHTSACLTVSSLREPAVVLSSSVETPLRTDVPVDVAVLLILGAFFEAVKKY